MKGDTLYLLGYIVGITKEQENEEILKNQKEEFETIFKYWQRWNCNT